MDGLTKLCNKLMSPDQKIYKRHCEDSAIIPASADEIFSFIDNPSRLSSHMSKSSWMMGGGRMKTSVDDGRGQKVGSHIRLSGKAFGIKIAIESSDLVTQFIQDLRNIINNMIYMDLNDFDEFYRKDWTRQVKTTFPVRHDFIGLRRFSVSK